MSQIAIIITLNGKSLQVQCLDASGSYTAESSPTGYVITPGRGVPDPTSLYSGASIEQALAAITDGIYSNT